ncbi:hypothetical protein F0U64_07820 [Achromobacter xylosoxidans]|uniref:hypothetical protein n=1 Tax=Alcaligenes xylosoxydans xylosoxydans TaxID=85698 RepID=UPI00122F765E|nr:hypothetical protein [Achromobacter xylosoxidans]QEQ22296.1 hypothetical protein F0U64_07820 [Achromobacter xylosoxidans]
MIKAWRMRRAFFICGRRIVAEENCGRRIVKDIPGKRVRKNALLSEGAPGKDSSGENALSKRAFGQNHLGRGLANRRTTLTATDPRSHPDRHIGRTATDSAGLRISHENPVVTAKHRIKGHIAGHINGHINGHASSTTHRGTPHE